MTLAFRFRIPPRLHCCASLLALPLALAADPAPAQDLCAGLVTDKAAHPMIALAKPALGQAVTDPQFGTAIRRISAAPAGGYIRPMYSTISAWNADESRLILYRVGQGHLLYDGRTYQFIRNLDITPNDLEQVYWHTSDPDLLYYVDDNRFIRYHVSTGVKDTLTTFSFCSTAGAGGDPMYISWDSSRIGLGCNDNSERFVYDISTNTVIGRKTLAGAGAPQASPSGSFTFLDGAVTDTALNVLRTLDLGNPLEHASLGKLASGQDTYNGVQYDPGSSSDVGALVTFDMTDGTSRVIVGPATGYPYPPSGIHPSAMAYKRPGYVSLSIVGNPSGSGVLDQEIVLADTNPGGKVCRVAHHRSWAGSGSVGYWAEPHAVPSPSGTRILFASDWGNSGTVDAFVVELPSYRSVSRDMDGDDRSDILWRHTGGALYVWQMNGTNLASSSYLPPISLAWTIRGMGDFNGDGQSDVLWRETTSGATYLWLMDGATTIGAGYTASQTDNSWTIQGVGDFDGDGHADILWRHTGGALYVWQMEGTAVKTSSYLPPISLAWQIQGLGDFDGDGKTDILWRETTSGATYLWFMNGASTTGAGYTASQTDNSWTIQGVGDFDADGKSDLLWRHDGGALYVWQLNGTATKAASYLPPISLAWQIQQLGDLDGDGKTDILWRENASGSTYVWLMNGAVAVSAGYTASQADNTWVIQAP